MAKYTVKHTTILHNKKVYKEGSTIELTDEQAKRLADFLDLVPETKSQTQNKTTNKPKTQTEGQKTATAETQGESADKTGKDETVTNNDKGGADGK